MLARAPDHDLRVLILPPPGGRAIVVPPPCGEGRGGGRFTHGLVPSFDSSSACATSPIRRRRRAAATRDTPSHRAAAQPADRAARPLARTAGRGPLPSS